MCRVEYQLPNLIVGAITKESLYSAFENGITADQAILSFGFVLLFIFSMNYSTFIYVLSFHGKRVVY